MNDQKTALILINWVQGDKEWDFQKSLSHQFKQVDLLEVNTPTKFATPIEKVLRLWPCYFKLGWQAFFQNRQYDVIIDYTCVAGLLLGIIYRIFTLKRPKIIILKFIYIERVNKLSNGLRYLFWRWGVSGVDLVICYSKAEAERHPTVFKCDAKKFVFIPVGVQASKFEQFRVTDTRKENYMLAAGYSNRDYPTFIKAVSSIDMPVVVIAKKFNLDSCELPPHVRVLYDVYGKEYYQLLQNAAFIVIPLADPTVSAGQEVALEAMYFGKAVIATKTQGLIDYIEDGYSGIFVNPGDVESMRKAIVDFKDHPHRVEDLGARGEAVVKGKFNMESFANRVADYAIAIAQKS